MYCGKYFDNRTHQHFVPIYSRVPYLDTEIFNIKTCAVQEERKIKNRTSSVIEGIYCFNLGI